jgi:hypothetical protein
MPKRGWREWLCPQPESTSRLIESAPSTQPDPTRRTRRTWLILPLFLGGWTLLNSHRHLIFVASNCSLVMLPKTSGTTDGTYIGEADWSAFAPHYPLLMARLIAGEGIWILGSLP